MTTPRFEPTRNTQPDATAWNDGTRPDGAWRSDGDDER